MQQQTFEIKGINPVELLGVNDIKLKQIKSYFPDLKIVARGNTLLINGEVEMVESFLEKLNQIIAYLKKYNTLSENNIDNLMTEDPAEIMSDDGSEVITHGIGGNKIKARSYNQRQLVKAINNNDMVFAIGPAGTGKTYTAVACAVRALKNKEVKRIILTRPAVEAGENLGFLPGDLKEKLDPYMMPLYDALRDMIDAEKLLSFMDAGIVEIAPLAFMRGRTLDKAFVILDEAQNTSINQMKMFLTRMGKNASFIITGDTTQIDLPPRQKSGLIFAMEKLSKIEGISFVHLNKNDVIRHVLVKRIIEAFEEEKNNEKPLDKGTSDKEEG